MGVKKGKDIEGDNPSPKKPKVEYYIKEVKKYNERTNKYDVDKYELIQKKKGIIGWNTKTIQTSMRNPTKEDLKELINRKRMLEKNLCDEKERIMSDDELLAKEL